MKTRVLNILKSSDKYVSGEEISRLLGISRAALCAIIFIIYIVLR